MTRQPENPPIATRNELTRELRSHASFRDSSGFVFYRDGVLLRQINASYQDDYRHLLQSGLWQKLVEGGHLVGHHEVNEPPFDANVDPFVVVAPERVPFVSYPYEWSFSQLKDAALATLDIQLAALDHDMSLKDASAFNFTFRDCRPVFIDTLSFERYIEGKPWPAYRQFCEHFLGPLALMGKVDIRLGLLSQLRVEGVPLDFVSRLLPLRTWLSWPLLANIHLHARSQKRHSGGGKAAKTSIKVSKFNLIAMLHGLRKTVTDLSWKVAGTEWRDYYANTTYSVNASDSKASIVAEYLNAVAPKTVWDIGANTGQFSRLAVQQGRDVIAFDVDPSAVELNYLEAKTRGETRILPLLLDVTNPSPGIGWAHQERSRLIDRADADALLALALVHHLAIANNIPLELIASYFARLSPTLIIEYVPKSDSQVKHMLASREDIFSDYTQEGFEAAFARSFTIEHRSTVDRSERIIYLMRAKAKSVES